MSAERKRWFNHRPFLTAALGMMAGVLLGRLLPGPSGYILSGVCFALAVLSRWTGIRWLPVFLAFLSIGTLRLELAYPKLPEPRKDCALTGTVMEVTRQGDGLRVILSEASADGAPIDGFVQLALPETGGQTPEYGQRLASRASLSLPRGARNEGGMDYRFYCFSRGIVCTARAYGPPALTDAPPGLYGRLLTLRDNATEVLVSLMGKENGALAAGMLHGAVEEIPEQTLEDFRSSGIAHLLSVSGLHVSLLAGALLMLLRHVKPVAQFIIVCAVLLFYCAFCAFAPPTLRAALMVVCLLLAKILHRRNDPLSALSFSFLILLLISPFALFSLGFQLSYTAVLGILLMYPALLAAMRRLPRTLSEPLALSVSAGLSTAPVSAAAFHSMSLLSVPANLLVVPLCALSMLPAGAALLLYPISGAAARFAASLSGAAIALMRAVARVAAGPGMLPLPPASFGAGVCFFLFLLFCSPYFLDKRSGRRLLCAVSAALCLLLWLAPLFTPPSRHVTVLDVAGYAVHIHTDGEDAVVGTPEALKSTAVESYLHANGIYDAAMEEGGKEGVFVPVGGASLFVSFGGAETGGVLYTTNANGQMRFYEKDGVLLMQPYARDARYAILIDKT
ncbi:MAG TPA: ComEC/Rec2 family competence protein [Feifaniaceae bacterium]|nr:ComEC/Rec2 family competence protein [Feifaniaceae bacterium]